LQIEFTAPGTPRQNGKVEKSFARLYGKVRAMLNGAKVDEIRRQRLWRMQQTQQNNTENIMVMKEGESSYNSFFMM